MESDLYSRAEDSVSNKAAENSKSDPVFSDWTVQGEPLLGCLAKT